jgi:hypothetical protein
MNLIISATLTNSTLDDRDGNITFSGDWTQQTGPNFYEQTSTYTQGAGNAFEFKFEGEHIDHEANVQQLTASRIRSLPIW